MTVIDCAKNFPSPIQIADVGTGSGCVAVTLAKQIPNSKVLASDVSDSALQVAQSNVDQHQIESQVTLLESDLFASFPETKFHIIASNPPYIGTEEIDTVEPNVDQYEPQIALYSGGSGTDVISRLIAEAPNHLENGGFLVFELSPIIADQCKQLVTAQPSLEFCEIHKDYSGHPRILVARKKSG